MQDFDEIAGQRVALKTKFGNWYLFISDHDIMITVAEENAPQHAEIRGMSESICRIASKGMKKGVTLSEVAEQMGKCTMGKSTILQSIADAIKDYAVSGAIPQKPGR